MSIGGWGYALATAMGLYVCGCEAAAAQTQAPVVIGVVNDTSDTVFSPGMRVWIGGNNFDSAAGVQVGGLPVSVIERRPWLGPTGKIGELVLVQLPMDLPVGATTVAVTSGDVS